MYKHMHICIRMYIYIYHECTDGIPPPARGIPTPSGRPLGSRSFRQPHFQPMGLLGIIDGIHTKALTGSHRWRVGSRRRVVGRWAMGPCRSFRLPHFQPLGPLGNTDGIHTQALKGCHNWRVGSRRWNVGSLCCRVGFHTKALTRRILPLHGSREGAHQLVGQHTKALTGSHHWRVGSQRRVVGRLGSWACRSFWLPHFQPLGPQIPEDGSLDFALPIKMLESRPSLETQVPDVRALIIL